MRRAYVWAAVVCLCAFGLLCSFASAETCATHNWHADYTSDAKGHYKLCTVCGASSGTESHVFTRIKTVEQASCKAAQKVQKVCEVCNYVDPLIVDFGSPTDEHSWGAYALTREASCTKEGEETSTCVVCGATRARAVPMLEHKYGDFEPHNEKWHIQYCKTCKKPYMRSHRLDAGEVTTAPTEASLGEIKYTCSVCGDAFTRSINAEGAIFAQESEDVLKNGVKYLRVESESLKDDASREVKLPDGSMMEVFADGESEIAVFANQATGAYAGLYVYGGKAVVEIVPNAATDTLNLEFVRVDDGAALTLRVFNANGEVAIDNMGGLGVVISQRRDAEGLAHTALVRTKLEGGAVTGSCIVYSSEKGEVVFNGVGANGAQLSLTESKHLYSLSWKYTVRNKNIALNATDAEGSYQGISYYLYVNNEEQVNASSVAKANGTVKNKNAADIWRLRVSYADGRELRTPAYTMDGKVAALTDGLTYSLTPLGAPVSTQAPPADQPPEADPATTPDAQITPPPDTAPATDAQTLTPTVTASVTPTEDPSESLMPTIVTMSIYDDADCVKRDCCTVSAYIGDGSMRVTVSDIMSDYTFKQIRFVQKFSGDGLSLRMKMAYSQEALFSVEPRPSVVYCEVVLCDKNGKEKRVKTDEYHLRAD